jgi:CRISPR-associated endonuclease/helicase Cas3
VNILRPWGKLGAGNAYHPAVYHMLDVGHVAQFLLGPDGPPRFRNTLARAMGAGQPRDLSEWLPLLVGLHDIAKISAPFQGQARQARTKEERVRRESEGFIFGSTGAQSYRHEKLGAVFIQDVLPQLEIGIDPATVTVLRDAIGGHHGRFPTPVELIKARDYCLFDEPPMWADMRTSAYGALLQHLAPNWTGGAQRDDRQQ